MLGKIREAVDKKVFIAGGLLCLIVLLCTVLRPEQAERVFSLILSVFCSDFGWLYLVSVLSFIVLLIAIALSKYGKIILGKDNDRPEHSTLSWFFMLFAAGMGIGLVFWSVAEPMSHFLTPPTGSGSTAEAASVAMRATFMHWGIHPWACYAVIGLPLAYFQFRKERPALLSSCLEPLTDGLKAQGFIGKTVDVLAVFATVFGVATSLGLGAMQINSGLHYVFGIPYNNAVIFGIITVTTALFITSSVSGIDRGIKLLSNINMVLFGLLLIFIFLAGSTLFTVNFFVDSLGKYISGLISVSFWTDPFGESNGWLNGWTIFYWAWWISWGPFVGGFIARISKGRTIRQFVFGTLLCPAILSFVFMTIMGGNAIHLTMEGVTSVAGALNENVSYALFAFLGEYPLAVVSSLVAVILVAIFFITSADSSTFVCAMMTAKGMQNPPPSLKVFWGVTEGLVAAVLLYAGGLTALQSASIIAAFPLMFVCFFIAFALIKALRTETLG